MAQAPITKLAGALGRGTTEDASLLDQHRSFSTGMEEASAGSSSRIDGPEDYVDVLIRQIGQIGTSRARDGSLVDPQDPESRREERRSPAAVMGSKKIGSVVLPYEMEQGIQNVVDGEQFMMRSV